ncbi:proprotein convertase P-domain-containing protein [Plantactinospora endophytica]|uniref:P/Homo B domain-containing protein n=1 Tax=Plantactinospora endophytica TaxID=673535 RepID=A0ABQ4DZC9_9ACTN|nr:proprotein convertase P-domain-containing protein [Plantactinospora endophytica]GIG87783.1 hypothetical protein Pen02_27190 [Plantactinospora endophytica]
MDVVDSYSDNLVVTLVAPDGSTHLLRNQIGDANDDIHETYRLNLSSERRSGTWKHASAGLTNHPVAPPWR